MSRPQENGLRFSTPALVVIAIAFIAILILFGRFCSQAATIHVTVNGQEVALHGAKTMSTAIDESGFPINPGDFISLSGNIIKRSEGYPFNATVNGEATVDPNRPLGEGDVIIVKDGDDRMEDYDVEIDIQPADVVFSGAGSICAINFGSDGETEHRTGRVTGEQVDRVISWGSDTIANWYNADVGDDKVVALTFNAGPSEEYTPQILDILSKNDVRATFFSAGSKVDAHPDITKRAWDTYNQVCTYTYDGTWTPADDINELADQVRRGRQAIANAVGVDEASQVVRFPEGNVNISMVAEVDEVVTHVIGWDVDTADWLETNSDEVYDIIMEAKPGNIIMLSDGGGDRSGTVEALRKAIPEMKAKGYSFVTIDELLAYPAKPYEG